MVFLTVPSCLFIIDNSNYTTQVLGEMADAGDDTFPSTDSGSQYTYPMQCSTLRKGGFVLIKNQPCKIVEMSTSKTGKHGHAKVHMVALNIFNSKKVEELCPSTHNMDVPHVKRSDYQVIVIYNANVLSLCQLLYIGTWLMFCLSL